MGDPEACQNPACAGFCQTDDFMKLPDGDHADLGTKIEDYVLNPSHWEGRHKARVFESVLGITINNQQVLREAVLAAAANSDEAEALGDNGHGLVYVLRFPLTTANGTAMILTAWIIRYAEDFPRLITCYIL
jgi:Domain of unknown function (DUF6883)